MSKIAVSILGIDCPGVVYLVSSTLAAMKCNIEEISQTILKGQFAAIFIAERPEELTEDAIHSKLVKAIDARDMSLSVIVRPLDEKAVYQGEEAEPFVITVDGIDSLNVVASFTHIFAESHVNIENMKALMSENSDGKQCALQVFEIALPNSIDRTALRRTLEAKGRDMGLRVSMQHRDIFEAMHRVSSI